MAVFAPETRNGADSIAINGIPPAAYVNGNGNLAHRLKMERKQSSPMMPAFMVSAPGKVIVFGEHAVVHGKVRLRPKPPFFPASIWPII